MHPWSLISPASRGIGFALTRRVLQSTNAPVIATTRKDPESTKEKLLDGLKIDRNRLKVLEVDFLEESTLENASRSCAELFPKDSYNLRLAFILPGLLFPEKSPAQIDANDALLTFRTNTIGPMLMLKHFSPFLPKKQRGNNDPRGRDETSFQGLPARSVTALMSARVGSVTDNRLGGWYSYRASKSAINQVVKTFDNHLQNSSGEQAIAVGLHPGTVKTDFSKEFWNNVKKEKLFEPEFVAESLLNVILNVDLNGRGKCWDWDGKEVPP